MGRLSKGSSERIEPTSADHSIGSPEHLHDCDTCPRCHVLEARITELEAIVAKQDSESQSAAAVSSRNIPNVDFKALRLIPHGWGEGWQLRPAPAAGTGWTSCHTHISAFHWSWPTNGAGNYFARPMLSPRGTEHQP